MTFVRRTLVPMPVATTPETRTFAAERRGVELVGLINVATAELTALIADVIAHGQLGDGFRSFEHWVTVRFGVSAGRAADLVRIARRRHELPATTAAFDRGALSEGHAALIARKVPVEREQQVLETAAAMTVSQLNRALRSLPDINRDPDRSPGDGPQPERSVTRGFRSDGWWEAHLLLPAEEGALVDKAWERAHSDLRRNGDAEAPEGVIKAPRVITAADAVVHAADAALRALDPSVASGGPASDRYQVIVHLDAATDMAHLHLGPALDATLLRYLTCDTSLRVVLEEHGLPVAQGRKTHTVPPFLRFLIEERDRQCVWPGCTCDRALQIHHIEHWEDGGLTDPENLVALCSLHHRLLHKGLISLSGDPTRPGGLRFTDRWGRPVGVTTARAVPGGTSPDDHAREIGLPPPDFTPPTGERLDPRWFGWN